jgi:DinB superfamily
MQTVTETTDKNELLASTDKAISEMLDLMSPMDNEEVNTVPYKDSWTAAMLFRHVSKSLIAMSGVMRMDAKPAQRDPGEKIPELKKAFLDFSVKMKSPDFIVPENGPYEKQSIFKELKNSLSQLKESAVHANLPDLVEGLPLGPITKLEILHFVMYHSQRHLHQMKKICKALDKVNT